MVTQGKACKPPSSSICSFLAQCRVLPSLITLTASPHLPGLTTAAMVKLAPLAYKVVQCTPCFPLCCSLPGSQQFPTAQWLPNPQAAWQVLNSLQFLFFQVTAAAGNEATLVDIVVQWRGFSPTQLPASHPSSVPCQALHVGPH